MQLISPALNYLSLIVHTDTQAEGERDRIKKLLVSLCASDGVLPHASHHGVPTAAWGYGSTPARLSGSRAASQRGCGVLGDGRPLHTPHAGRLVSPVGRATRSLVDAAKSPMCLEEALTAHSTRAPPPVLAWSPQGIFLSLCLGFLSASPTCSPQ